VSVPYLKKSEILRKKNYQHFGVLIRLAFQEAGNLASVCAYRPEFTAFGGGNLADFGCLECQIQILRGLGPTGRGKYGAELFPENALRRTPNKVLKEHSARKDLLSDIDFDSLSETESDVRLKSLSCCRNSNLQPVRRNGGGGIRTPVPRCFKTSLYMLSRLIVFSPHQAPNDRLLAWLFRRVLTSPARTTGSASLLCDALT